MDRNPFEYVRPLPPAEVAGRDELVHRLVSAVVDRELVAVLGPRRVGKTSLLGRGFQVAFGRPIAPDPTTVPGRCTPRPT